MSDVRVRFAPSPTGLLHVGGARTALFNWLYARHTGGKLILRIEDTDAARNTPEALAIILKGLSWLGLDWDEGPTPDGTGEIGDHAPYYQSRRGEIYQRYIEGLLSSGKAYEDEGAVKFRTPKTPCTVHDLICGDIQFDRTNDPDLVIRRANGAPVFHLVNVVDDLEMAITHVIRGEDHLSNTPKHLALFEALGATPPHYAHIPLILNTNGSKMSKRDDGASIGQYIDQGYLPAAVVNYLCLLGWSSKDNREVQPIADVIERFDLPQINRSNARFDLNKLFWINGEYWDALDKDAYENFARSYLESRNALPADTDPAYLAGALGIIREKIKIGRDLPEWIEPFVNEDYAFDEKALRKTFKDPDSPARLPRLRDAFAATGEWTATALEATLHSLATSEDRKTADFIHPCRVAISGKAVGPSLFHMLEVMGRDRVLRRLERAVEQLVRP